jgi:hypothetical protein
MFYCTVPRLNRYIKVVDKMVGKTAKLTKCHVTIGTLNSTQGDASRRTAWL